MPQRTVFPVARGAFSETYDSLSDVEFADAVAASTGMSAVDVESWLSNLGRTFQQMAPGMLQGAVSGASTGAALGPWGALIGGLGGAVAGGLSSSGGRAPAPTAGAGAAPAPAPAATGAPAAGALMQMLANPQVQQALMSMLAGRGGRESVDVGERAVPVTAFAEAIRELADVAIAQYEATGESGESTEWSGYLESQRRDGTDTGNALVRGVLLAKLLEPTPYGYVPAVPAVPVTAAAAYAPVAPAATAPGAAAPAVAPAAQTPGGYEPTPAYGTPDLGIGVPITLPTQAEAYRRALADHAFTESLDAIFELNGYA